VKRIVSTALIALALVGIGREGYQLSPDNRRVEYRLTASKVATNQDWAALADSLDDLKATVQEAKKRTADERARWVRYQMADGHKGFSYTEVRRSIVAAVERWGVPGGLSKALSVASCESGLNEFASNPYSSAAGVFQIVSGTWSSWYGSVVTSRPAWSRKWDVKPSVFNARSNVIVSIIHAHRYGWGAWVCQ